MYRPISTRKPTLLVLLALAASALASCGGGGGSPPKDPPPPEDPAKTLNEEIVLPIDAYELLDPETDESIVLEPPETDSVDLIPGETGCSPIVFQAPNANVVGAGIRFGTTGPIRVVPSVSAMGQTDATMLLDFSVPDSVCANLSSICHSIICYEFAVTDAGKISRANIMQVALACGNCDEPSCQSLLQGCQDENPFQGTISGSWSGMCDDEFSDEPYAVSGTFSLILAPDGTVTGSYDGDDFGDISGTVSMTGSLSATGTGAAGGCNWSGQFSGSTDTLAGSGNWGCDFGCSGGWSGS